MTRPDDLVRGGSWTGAFARSHEEYKRTQLVPGAPAHLAAPPQSVDALFESLPLEPVGDEEMDSLHRSAIRAIVVRELGFISSEMEMAAEMCASPIERVMLYALCVAARDYVDGVLVRANGAAYGRMCTHGGIIEIEPQARVGAYRVDFLLKYAVPSFEPFESEADPHVWRLGPVTARATSSLIVECDGYEFHERTPAQATNDRARDRVLQADGFRVLRYMGREIWADVFAHAHQAIQSLPTPT